MSWTGPNLFYQKLKKDNDYKEFDSYSQHMDCTGSLVWIMLAECKGWGKDNLFWFSKVNLNLYTKYTSVVNEIQQLSPKPARFKMLFFLTSPLINSYCMVALHLLLGRLYHLKKTVAFLESLLSITESTEGKYVFSQLSRHPLFCLKIAYLQISWKRSIIWKLRRQLQ